MNRNYFLLPLLSLCVFLARCGHSGGDGATLAKSDTIPVRLLPLQQGQVGSRIESSGLFTSDDETVLSFKNGGVVSKIYVKEGDAVKKGQLLASLNPTEIDAAYGQAKLSEEKAERDYKRALQLYKDSVATLEQLQNAETAFKVAQQQLSSASFNRNQTEIRAFSSGYVMRKLANEGQVVGAGTPILQVNGAAQHSWQLRVGLSDREWASIAVGDKAYITFEALNGDSIPARVHKKSESIDPSSGTFNAMLMVDGESKYPIGSGMFAKATIWPKNERQVWHIPFEAILDADAGKAYVFASNDGKTARRVPVRIADIQDKGVLVTDGLEGVQHIIISGSAYLNDGSPIKVIHTGLNKK
ncbi:efflux RND transporter periplasmic adaptor subunit [Olivibacter sitiensis]|uniref:efflux RND transporter periplasmic adaptor subunit n=1 Tax=Olivibacter sitiensis TaxID=376470 RepID=UPI0004885E82|nr:efflux RND transporter periplasmic adaptor subunit [Olivibacter sitiensis]